MCSRYVFCCIGILQYSCTSPAVHPEATIHCILGDGVSRSCHCTALPYTALLTNEWTITDRQKSGFMKCMQVARKSSCWQQERHMSTHSYCQNLRCRGGYVGKFTSSRTLRHVDWRIVTDVRWNLVPSSSGSNSPIRAPFILLQFKKQK
jgi:hypothetical protein